MKAKEIAKKIVDNGEFSLSFLSSENIDTSSLQYKLICAYDGVPYSSLAQKEKDVFIKYLAMVMSAEENVLHEYLSSARSAASTLHRLRAGQPDSEIFKALSPQYEYMLSHIKSLVDDRKGAVKFLLGDRGTGKTTLAQIIAEENAGERIAVSVYVASMASTAPMRTLFHSTFMTKPIVLAVTNSLRAKTQDERDRILAHFITADYYTLLKCIIYQVNNHKTETDQDFASDYVDALGSLLDSGKRTPINLLYKAQGIETRPPDKPHDSNIESLVSDWLRFLGSTDVYPIVILDEFEAYVRLWSGYSERLLDFIRMITDNLYSNGKHGLLMILSTRDGFSIIKNDPALYSRFSSSSSSIMSGIWPMDKMSSWDKDQALGVFHNLYKVASETSDKFYTAVNENVSHIDGFDRLAGAIIESTLDPRLRIKEILDLFDGCADDPHSVSQQVKIFIDKDTGRIDNLIMDVSDEFPSVQSEINETKSQDLPVNTNQTETSSPDYELDLFDDSDPFCQDESELVSDSLEKMFTQLSSLPDEEPEVTSAGLAALEPELICHEDERLKAISSSIKKEMKSKSIQRLMSKINTSIGGKSLWMDYLMMKDSPLLVNKSGAGGNLHHAVSRLKSKTKRYHTLAALYSSFRDHCGDDEHPLLLSSDYFVNICHRREPNQEVIDKLNMLMSIALWEKGLPVQLRTRPEEKQDDAVSGETLQDRVELDVFSGLSMTRRFVYTYLAAHGVMCSDIDVDRYVINWYEEAGISVMPSRMGSFFFRNGRLESLSQDI